MPGRRTSWCVLAGLITLAACTDSPASGPASSPPATPASAPASERTTNPTPTPSDTVVEPLPDDEASAEPATGCENVVVLDEYGFPVEFELCSPDDDGSVDMSPTAILMRVPSDRARTALDAGHEAAQRLAAECVDTAAWSRQAERLLPGLVSTIELVREDPALSDWVGGPDARALADEFRDLIVFPSDCDGGREPDDADQTTALATAGRLAGVNDDLRFAFDVPEQILFGSDFWYATDQIGHLVDTTLLRESEAIEVLLMGASTVKRGIDPVQLGAATGRSVYNAAVGALAPDLQLSWYRELRDSGVEPGTVVIGLNTWIEFLECESPQKDRVAETDDRRERAFANIAALASSAPGTRLAGGDPPSYTGRALVDHRVTWVPGTGGRLELTDDYQQGVADIQADQYRALSYGGLCADRLDRLAALASEIIADGSDVVFVVLPTSDVVVDFHPEGRAGHTVALDEYRNIAGTTGASLVDLSDLVAEELYVDLTHVGNAGRAMITEELVDIVTSADRSTS